MRSLQDIRTRVEDIVESRRATSTRRAGANVRIRQRQRIWDVGVSIGWKAWPIGAFIVAVVGAINVGAGRLAGPWLSGALTGAFVASMSIGIVWVVVLVIGAAPAFSGADAEAETARELARLPDGWFVVHDIHFPMKANIDHVVVGPAGLFAFETKWTQPTERKGDYERRFLNDATGQAKETAQTLRSRLLSVPHHLRVQVQPVVVLSGGSKDRPDVDEINGIPVLNGAALATWLSEQSPDATVAEHRSAIEHALSSFINDANARQELEPLTPMMVQHGAGIVPEAMLLAVGLLCSMVVALRFFGLGAFWWFVAVLAAAAAAWLGAKKVSRRGRVRAWLLVSSQCWSGIVTLGALWVLVDAVR